MVIEGHSFMPPNTALPQVLNDAVDTSAGFYNSAVGGSTIAMCVSRVGVVNSKFITETSQIKNALVVYIGTNDVTNTPGTGAAKYAELKSYIQSISANVDKFVYTITPSTVSGKDGRFETERDTFNGLLRTDLALLDRVYILDTDTISELDDSTDTTYYLDLVHPSWTGVQLLASLFTDKISQLYTPSVLSAAVPDVPITMELSATGTGDGVATLTISVLEDVSVTIDANGTFYSDAGGTLNPSTTKKLYYGISNIVYIKVTSGTSNMVLEKNKIIQIGGWASVVNAPSLKTDISLFQPYLVALYIPGQNEVFGDISNFYNLIAIQVTGNNALSGIIRPSGKMVLIHITGVNTCSCDIAELSPLATRFWVVPSGEITYNGSGDWSKIELNNWIRFQPNTGLGLSLAEMSLMIQEINSTKVGGRSIYIYLTGACASLADTAQGGIWGDFDGETSPSALATAYKNLVKTDACITIINGIAAPGVSGDGTGFPAGFGDWYRS
jgi:lysophospholipase L1-like esterase